MYCEEAFKDRSEGGIRGTALGLRSQISRCPASYASGQRDTARICCCAPCCSPVKLRRRPCSNWYLLPEGAAATATRRTRLQWVNGTNSGRSPYRYIESAPHIMRSVPIAYATPGAKLPRCYRDTNAACSQLYVCIITPRRYPAEQLSVSPGTHDACTVQLDTSIEY